jgi:hypothetical protein
MEAMDRKGGDAFPTASQKPVNRYPWTTAKGT